MDRWAEGTVVVDVLDDDAATRAARRATWRASPASGASEMGENEARVHHVVLVPQPSPWVQVADLELDVGHLRLLGIAARELDLRRVEVDTRPPSR